MDKDESPQTGARAARSAHETGGPATSGLQEGNVSHRKYIPDIGWDRLTPPDYSSPGTQVEPGDSLEAEAEGAGGGLGGGRAGGTPPPCSAHPSPGTGSACGQGGSAGGPSRPCRTARPRSAPSRRTTGRKSAGRRPPACTPPTRAGRRGGAAHLAPCPRRDLGEAPGRTPPRAHPPTAGVGLCALRPWGMLARPHSPASPSTRRRLRGHPPTHPLATLRPHHKAQTGSGGLGPMLGQCAGA